MEKSLPGGGPDFGTAHQVKKRQGWLAFWGFWRIGEG